MLLSFERLERIKVLTDNTMSLVLSIIHLVAARDRMQVLLLHPD
jgi:hypothetical protein